MSSDIHVMGTERLNRQHMWNEERTPYCPNTDQEARVHAEHHEGFPFPRAQSRLPRWDALLQSSALCLRPL